MRVQSLSVETPSDLIFLISGPSLLLLCNSLPAIMAPHLPPNVRVSKHPCLRAKLSQLRSKSTNARETKTLVHEIALLLGVDALSNLEVEEAGKVS